jgi:RHS repeat-associated protein
VDISTDAAGNTTVYGNRTFSYDQANRLTQVQEDGITIGTYATSADGRRMMKTADSNVTVYHYDLEGHLIAESDGQGSLTRLYIYLNGAPLAMFAAGGETDSVYYYHNDHLGTPLRLTDAIGTVAWAADYLPFGGVDITVETVENYLRFAGQYHDAETGLHYNYWRYYDPKIGRYLRADPIGLKGGINLFAYVQNNPINLIDPYGLITLPEIYAKVETFAKPYTIGGALVTTGGVTAVAGSALTVVGYASIPESGPAGALAGTVGVAVTAIGASMFTLGLDVYSDELRYQLGLPKWFDIIRDFELLPKHSHEDKNQGGCE